MALWLARACSVVVCELPGPGVVVCVVAAPAVGRGLNTHEWPCGNMGWRRQSRFLLAKAQAHTTTSVHHTQSRPQPHTTCHDLPHRAATAVAAPHAGHCSRAPATMIKLFSVKVGCD